MSSDTPHKNDIVVQRRHEPGRDRRSRTDRPLAGGRHSWRRRHRSRADGSRDRGRRRDLRQRRLQCHARHGDHCGRCHCVRRDRKHENVACPRAVMEQESKFFAALRSTRTWRIDSARRKLALLDADGKPVVVFARI
jgi:META domain-containing protein